MRRIWMKLKRWRIIQLGPVALFFRVQRAIRVTKNSRERCKIATRRNYDWVLKRALSDASSSLSEVDSVSSQRQRSEIALIVGVGPGFGYALAQRLASAGMLVVLASRDANRLDDLIAEILLAGGTAIAYGCDATNEGSVVELFHHVVLLHGIPNLVVYSLQNFGAGNVVDIELAAFEDGWRHNCLGAFLVARQAARAMLTVGAGSIVLVGSTSSLIGRSGHLNLAAGKFGQRAISQVLARELWPQGIHVAHLIIDADVYEGAAREDGGPQSDPADIAELVLSVHRQPRTAWTSEVDVRPWNERFWEHC